MIPRVAFDHELVPKTNLTLIVQPTRPQCPFKVTGDNFAHKKTGVGLTKRSIEQKVMHIN